MDIPKIISKDDHEYIFEKEYDKHVLYKDMITGVKECFLKFDLLKQENKIKEIIKYNLYDNEELLGTYTMKEMEEIIKKTRGSIYSATMDRRLFEGRWRIVKIKKEEIWKKNK